MHGLTGANSEEIVGTKEGTGFRAVHREEGNKDVA